MLWWRIMHAIHKPGHRLGRPRLGLAFSLASRFKALRAACAVWRCLALIRISAIFNCDRFFSSFASFARRIRDDIFAIVERLNGFANQLYY